jgi:hypothetical protein
VVTDALSLFIIFTYLDLPRCIHSVSSLCFFQKYRIFFIGINLLVVHAFVCILVVDQAGKDTSGHVDNDMSVPLLAIS